MPITLISESSTGSKLEPQTFPDGSFELGRAPGNDYVIAQQPEGVSSKHARFVHRGGAWTLTDLGSTNGTRLNGERVAPNQPMTLQNGAVVIVGHWKIECQIDASAPAAPAPPPAPPGKLSSIIPAAIIAPKPGSGTASSLPVPTLVPPVQGAPPVDGARAAPAGPLQFESSQSEVNRVALLLRETIAKASAGNAAQVIQEALQSALSKIPTEQHLDLLEKLRAIAAKQSGGGAGAVLQAVEAELLRQRSLREASFKAMVALSHERANTDAQFRDHGDVTRFFKLVDQSLELTLEWIVSCLSGRRAFEEKFGAKVTKFFGLESNPIKHALSAPQAGAYLLGWEHDRDPAQIQSNLEDAFRDLTAHQLALIAGVQNALKAALGHLDPGKHEQKARDKAGAFSRALGLSVDKEAWSQLKQTYKELFDNESKLFNEVIFPNVRQGYLAAHDEQGMGKSGEGE